MFQGELTEAQLEQVYNWVDEVPLSRPKRNMPRDFSDGVLYAQIIEHYNPKIIELHNYGATGSITEKINNWKTLNRKVLSKLKLTLKKQEIQSLANATPGNIQALIYKLKKAIEKGEISSPSVVSKTNTSISFSVFNVNNKPRPLNKMSYKDIKNEKPVKQLVSGKDQEINLFKNQIQLLVIKSGKLEQILKGKDRQIQEMVRMIKNNKKL